VDRYVIIINVLNCISNIVSRDLVTLDGVWIGNLFIELLQLVATSTDNAVAILHVSPITV
jgi:hypothetical protein